MTSILWKRNKHFCPLLCLQD